jgi:predicted ATPase
VVESAPGLGELLAACPNLGLLVTSREPLRLAAEQEYPVPPFVEPKAVGFFFSRARAMRPEFEDDGFVHDAGDFERALVLFGESEEKCAVAT